MIVSYICNIVRDRPFNIMPFMGGEGVLCFFFSPDPSPISFFLPISQFFPPIEIISENTDSLIQSSDGNHTGRGVVLSKKQFLPTVSFSASAHEFSSDFFTIIKGHCTNHSY